MSVLDAASPIRYGSVWDDFIAGLTVGVVLVDRRGQVLATNDIAADLMRLGKTDLLTGRRPADWCIRDDMGAAVPDWADLAGQVLRSGAPLSTPLQVSVGGEPASRLWADYHPVRCQGRDRVLVLLHPVQDDVPHSRGLLDPLTGLPSRALLLDRLDQALVRARTHGGLTTLVLADVLRLAAFNDEHGFGTGDELLGMLSARLRQEMREDHTVGRYCGTVFAVVAEHPSGTGELIAERVREIGSRPVRIGHRRVRAGLKLSWVTTDGHAPVHSVVTRAERQLGCERS